MNTHDKYELPEHDCLYESTNEQGYIDLEPAYRKSTVLRLLEADRQQSDTRTSRSVEQLKEALLSRNQRFVATHSEVKNLIEYYEADRQRRGEPVAWTTPDGAEPISAGLKEARLDLYGKHYTVPLYKSPQPAEPVKRKRRYAQGTALGEFGIIPMCDQVNDEPVKVPSALPVTEQEEEEWRRMEAGRD